MNTQRSLVTFGDCIHIVVRRCKYNNMSVLACQLIDVLLYLVGNVVIFFSSLYLVWSSFEATSFYIIYLLITHVL
jgi:hypothetical protein